MQVHIYYLHKVLSCKLLESIQDKEFVNKLTGGLPWYCYTYRQTHCRPLFKMPRKWRTTTKPYVSKNPARSTTRPPATTTIRPPGCRKFQPIIFQKHTAWMSI